MATLGDLAWGWTHTRAEHLESTVPTDCTHYTEYNLTERFPFAPVCHACYRELHRVKDKPSSLRQYASHRSRRDLGLRVEPFGRAKANVDTVSEKSRRAQSLPNRTTDHINASIVFRHAVGRVPSLSLLALGLAVVR